MAANIYSLVSAVFCIALWFTLSLFPISGEYMNKTSSISTVHIGVIVDRSDEKSGNINRSITLAMTVTNTTKYVRMNPIIRETTMDDSFKLRQTFCDLIERQPIAFLGTSRSETYNIIHSYSRAMRIPFFLPTMAREASLDLNNYIISMCPSFIEAVIDFIKFSNWDRIFYLFDTDDALWRLQKLYLAFNNQTIKSGSQPCLIDAIRIPDVTNCRDVLRKLDRNYNFDTKRIVVDLSSIKDYDRFMSQIIDVGMNRDGYHYLLGTLDINGMNVDLWKSFRFGGVNITGFQLINRKKWSHRIRETAELLEEGQQTSIDVFLTFDAVIVLTNALVTIRQSSNSKAILPFRRNEIRGSMNCSSDPIKPFESGQAILERIRNVSIPGLSGTLEFDHHGYRKGYTLDLFHLSYRSPLRQVGYWKQGEGLTTTLKDPKLRKEVRAPNRTRIVTTIINKPFMMLNDQDNGKPLIGNDRYKGYCVDMLKEIAKMINLTYMIVEVDDESYGTKLENGTWDGMIGKILSGDADLAVASLTITHSRENKVRFSKPFMNTGISIMIKKPEKEKPGVFSFMEPLSYKVWACIMAGFFSVSFILYMVGRFSPYEWQEDETAPGPSETFSFLNTLWFSLGALMQQGPDIFPRSLSGRVLGSAWWFFTLIMISSYTANLAAFLTFEKLTTPIDSVDDLAKQTTIKYGIRKSGSTLSFFKDSKVQIYQKMYNVMEETVPNVYVDHIDAGWHRVISGKGKYAFLLEASNNNYYNQRKPCKTMKVGRNLDQKGYGIATPKQSDLSHDLNIAVLQLSETGFLIKLEQKWWYSKGECGASDGGEKQKSALNLSNVSGIFHILIGGLVLAMIISLSQIVFHAKIKPRPHQTTYRVTNPPRDGIYSRPKRVTIEDPPVITCTTSNGGEPHLIHFDDTSDQGIVSLDEDDT